MRDKKIEVDATLREIPAYTLGEVPIFRLEHRLDDFQTGELNRHWHSEFLFGLVTEGTLDYYYNPTSSHVSHATLEKGDGVFVNSGVLHGCRQLTGGSRLFTFGMTPAFFSSPMFGKLYQNIIVPVTPLPGARGLFPQALSRKTGRFYGCSRSLKNSAPGRRTMSSTPSSWCAASGGPC